MSVISCTKLKQLRNLMETFSKHCRFILTYDMWKEQLTNTKSLSVISNYLKKRGRTHKDFKHRRL